MRTGDCLALMLLMTACDPRDGKPDRVTSAPDIAPVVSIAAVPIGPRLLAPADPAGSVIDFAAIQGRWEVVGVALADGRVQAFVPDDPAYMGRSMVVDGKTLAWATTGAATTATINDRCTGAATMRLTGTAVTRAIAGIEPALRKLGVARPDPHEVACLDGGSWGGSDGGALLFPIDARTLAMRWYDNVVLKLRWQAP
jgi:hypothetical protein